jgi:hypothetical protein
MAEPMYAHPVKFPDGGKCDGPTYQLQNIAAAPHVRLEAMARLSSKRLAQLKTDVCNQLRAKSGSVWETLVRLAELEELELTGEPEFPG